MLLWSLLAPLGAVAFGKPGRAWPWFGAFVATILLSVALSEVVRPDAADLPNGFVRTFDLLNIILVSFVAMLLLVHLRAEARDRAGACRALLLNVLPAEIAQRLQSDPNSIADRFDSDILFADVVDFRRSRADSTRAKWSSSSVGLFTSFDELVDARRGRSNDRRPAHGRGGRPDCAAGSHARWRGSRSRCASAPRPAFPKTPSTTCASASASARGRSWPA